MAGCVDLKTPNFPSTKRTTPIKFGRSSFVLRRSLRLTRWFRVSIPLVVSSVDVDIVLFVSGYDSFECRD